MTMIMIVDMHIRDERVLQYIRERAKDSREGVLITHQEIANHFGCHRNTSLAIIHRLEGAGWIDVDKRSKRGGYLYTYTPE